MQRTTTLLLAALCCLCFAGCSTVKQEDVPFSPAQTAPAPPETGAAAEEIAADSAPQSLELVGPWHLDDEKNDLAVFADSLELFPGYGEWGAGMEIRSNGQMSWYIGAEGWHGTYTLGDGVIHAQLTSDPEQSAQLWDFRITEENGTAILEMDYPDMTIYWMYGDQEDGANGTDKE